MDKRQDLAKRLSHNRKKSSTADRAFKEVDKEELIKKRKEMMKYNKPNSVSGTYGLEDSNYSSQKADSNRLQYNSTKSDASRCMTPALMGNSSAVTP